jgi:hypothetical protein
MGSSPVESMLDAEVRHKTARTCQS